MHFIYDNLTATIVATTVTMLLIGIQLRSSKTNVAETSRNIVKGEAQNFATWLEDDLERMGENIDQDKEVPFENPAVKSLSDSKKLTQQFTFYRDSITASHDTVRIATRYQIKKKGTAEVDGKEKDLYQLVRKTKVGGGTWGDEEIKGASTPSLGYFKIDMLDRNGNVVPSPKDNADDVQSVSVSYSVVAPFQNQRTLLPVTHVGSVLVLREDDEAPGQGGMPLVPQTKADCTGGGKTQGWQVMQRPDGTGFDNACECKVWVTGSSSAKGSSGKGSTKCSKVGK